MNRQPHTISFYRKKLPHWEVADGIYFVTIRRHGSIPMEIIAKIRKMSLELENLSDGDALNIRRKIFKTMENELDKSDKKCDLIKSPISKIIIEAIKNRADKNIWRMVEYVIMPNHIHLFLQCGQKSLAAAIRDFKRWTTSRINMDCPEYSRGPFWQREWFDHWSRSADFDEKFKLYIRNNPAKAGLVKDYKDWPFGSWAQNTQVNDEHRLDLTRPSLDEAGS
jgi:REP element-mobilizing transposase RayT